MKPRKTVEQNPDTVTALQYSLCVAYHQCASLKGSKENYMLKYVH